MEPTDGADDPKVYDLPIDDQIAIFIDDHRGELLRSLDGLTEDQARRRLVTSPTTLLGLVRSMRPSSSACGSARR